MARRPRENTPPEDDARSGDEKIIDEAKERFARAQSWEIPFRQLYLADVKFANADADNMWQWPDTLKSEREKNQRPMLTINKVGPLCELIVNDARQNKPSVKIKPTSEKVSAKAAEVWEGLVRNIEYISNAQAIYDQCTESMVEGGIGWLRVGHDFVDDESFDQEIRILPIRDHLGVYLDPDIKQRDGSDAKWAFVFTEKPRKEYEKEHPTQRLQEDLEPSDGIDPVYSWVRKDYVREAEYYRIVELSDELIFMEDAQGQEATFRRSDVPENIKAALAEAEKSPKTFKLRTRKIKRRQLEWFKIGGGDILQRRGKDDEQPMKGSYIPLVRFVGKEKIIDGKLERKGHVRPLKDAQRIWNYHTSANVEFVALQSKTPYVAPAAAIEGNQGDWFSANTNNKAVLIYRHRDADGNEIPKPERQQPPSASQGNLEGMKVAGAEIEMASGQYSPQKGEPGNERSGKAIDARNRRGDTATYHWIDAVGVSICHLGKIILDLAPHIYDTKRIVKVLAKDGSLDEVQFDPDAEEAHSEIDTQMENEAKVLFNPKLAKCAVQADIGPAYATQRQETWNAFVQIITQNKELTEMIGDLGFLAADFPMADKIAERLRRHIENTKPWLLDDSKTGPLVQELQQQIGKAQAQIGELMTKLTESQIRGKAKDELRDIDAFDADTRRLTGEANSVKDLSQLDPSNPIAQLIMKQLGNMMGFDVSAAIEKANQDSIDNEGDEPGAASGGDRSGGE